MGINYRCPRCGSQRVQLTSEAGKHGCMWLILFGVYFVLWVFVKWIIGFIVFVLYDWWMAIVHKACGKGHVWQSKKWFSRKKRLYYCHDCGHNFRAG